MPRANRHFLPGHVWHLTHRCHERDFLLKFARDRGNYLRWLYEARKRFGLCVLNDVVTSNHIDLLVKDTEEGVIARSVQLCRQSERTGVQPKKGSPGRLLGRPLSRHGHRNRCPPSALPRVPRLEQGSCGRRASSRRLDTIAGIGKSGDLPSAIA